MEGVQEEPDFEEKSNNFGVRIKKLKGRNKGHKQDICQKCSVKFRRKTRHKRNYCDECLAFIRSNNSKKKCKVKEARGYKCKEEILKDIETMTAGAVIKHFRSFISNECGTTITGIKVDKGYSKQELIQIREWLKCNLNKDRLR